MTESIPGGRQRALSVGNALDEDDDESGFYPRPLTDNHRHFSRSLHLDSVKNSGQVDYTLDQDRYRTLPSKPKRRGKPSFKSVKNLMSRLIHSSSNRSEEDSGNGHGGRGGMAHSRRKGDLSPERSESTQGSERSYTDCASRPLFTKTTGPPNIVPTWTKTPGRVGIVNHGNTCFMNAILQCLNNTDCFVDFFIKKFGKSDQCNKTLSRRLGLSRDGNVSEHLGLLFNSLWSDKYNSDISNLFKNVVGRANNQYKGTSQHDAQEFLLWLLDCINEDLQMSRKRQQTLKQLINKAPPGKKLTDEQAAEEILMANNGCSLYNLFQALYRSSLQCPNCGKRSNTFETYLCLSLPLPHKVIRPVYVIVVEQIEVDRPPKQVKIGLRMDANATVKELRIELSKLTDIPENRMVLCQIYDDGFRNTYGDEQPLTDIGESETIHAIETLPDHPSSESNGQSHQYEQMYTQILLVHTEKESCPTKYFRFCTPQVLRVPRDIDGRELQKEILYNLDTCVKNGLLSQKLDVLFKLRLLDGSPGRDYLPSDVDMPLFTENVDRALSTYGSEYGPQHIKLVAEWEPAIKQKVIVHDNDKVEEHSSVRQVKQQQQQHVKVSLDECLQLFTKEEKLTGDDAWLCTHCKKQQQGTTKTLGLWSLPDIFVIHLKRFRQVGLRRNKLNTLIDFPVRNLDMAKHILRQNGECDVHRGSLNITPQQEQLHKGAHKDQTVYDLYAVCNHYGNMLGGHYTAYCKNPLDDRWYEFDDSKVTSIAEAEVKTSSAYMLFYQRQGFTPIMHEDLQNNSHWIYNLYPRSDSLSSHKTAYEGTDKAHVSSHKIIHDSHDGRPVLSSTQTLSRNSEHRQLRDWQRTETGLHVNLNGDRKSPVFASSEKSSYVGQNTDHCHGLGEDRLIKLDQNNVSKRQNRLSQHGLRADLDGMTSMLEKERLHSQNHNQCLNMDIKSDQKYPGNQMTTHGNLHDNSSHQRTEIDKSGVLPLQLKDRALVDIPAKGRSPSSSHDADVHRPVTPGSPKKQRTPHSVKSAEKAKEMCSADSGKPPPVPVRNQSLTLHRGRDQSHNNSDSSRTPSGFSTPPQTRRKSSGSHKQAWSTPQPPRKQNLTLSNGYHDQADVISHNSLQSSKQIPLRPPPPSSVSLQRQSSMPHRTRPDISLSPQVEGSRGSFKEYSRGNRTNDHHPSPSQDVQYNRKTGNERHSASDSRLINSGNRDSHYNSSPDNMGRNTRGNKYATFTRPGPKTSSDDFNIEITRAPGLPKSRTDNSISAVDKNFVNATGTPLLNQARCRQPVCDTSHSHDSLSYTEVPNRYQPHKHYYKQFPYKDQVKLFKKEKMYSPCLKESSV